MIGAQASNVGLGEALDRRGAASGMQCSASMLVTFHGRSLDNIRQRSLIALKQAFI